MNKKELHTKFGVTDEQLDAWAAEYENESWDGLSFGTIIQGRPRIYNEELKTITVKVPVSRIAAIQHAASKNGMSRSEFVRQAIDNELMAAS
ncbi:MAG: ribbon-helix-helix domain-containing protein [Coriobacteriales bacterium]|jgi:predicted DNA binding CopG/RHH family protein|nr:ribbon-helix-helix domain-containing protein [Coriobacteriales bacterium]